MKKIILLGGSNSVMKTGLRLGLCDVNDICLAVGATSSLQNIHAICENMDAIENCDYIVTESNVNDAYNINNVGVNKQLVFDNIEYLYDELYKSGKKVISIIIPIKHYSDKVIPKDLIIEINCFHKDLSKRYGFHVIDLENYFLALDASILSTKFIQPDSLHPIDSFMYALGLNVRNFIFNQKNTNKTVRREPSNFLAVKIKKGDNKKNSIFERFPLELNKKTIYSIDEGKLIGIETWSDGVSELLIESGDRNIVKRFNSKLSFNEISGISSTSFALSSHLGKSLGVSEPSVNVDYISDTKNYVKLTSLLFVKKNTKKSDVAFKKTECLDFLIPKKEVFINSIVRILDGEVLLMPNDIDADYLRDAAIKLESFDINLSLYLINMAQKIRPKGPFIRKKKEEYLQTLKNLN